MVDMKVDLTAVQKVEMWVGLKVVVKAEKLAGVLVDQKV